jgi:hypothetical protein
MTPVEYRNRYLAIPVVANGASRTVKVETYRIGTPDPEQGILWQKLKEHFIAGKKKDPTFKLTLRVNGRDESFASSDAMLRRVVNPFWGKGSPEDCQITLEVAVLLGVTTMDKVQLYADKHIGLDCNGFVGNYIWHEHLGKGWQTWGGDAAPSPSANIDAIFTWVTNQGRQILAIEEMAVAKKYVLAMLDRTTLQIIPGGPSSRSGHIVITEPNRFMPQSFVYDTMGFYDLGLAKKGAYGHPAYYAVESTGPEFKVGLKESWYAFRPHLVRQLNKQTNKHEQVPRPGVFNVFRGSKAGTGSDTMLVKVAELG